MAATLNPTANRLDAVHTPGDVPRNASRLRQPWFTLALSLTLAWIPLLLLPATSRAEVRFDVFLGYDDYVREGHWFPVAFEIENDGPPFTATVIVGAESSIETQQRQFAIELPTGTLKRVVIPVFPSSGRYTRWDARLFDPDGKLVAERGGIPAKDVAPHMPILGALPRTFGGLPSFPEIRDRGPEFLPTVARLQSDYLPSNPIALEGLTAIYLNSEKALALKPEQIDALLSWLNDGGHLIVAIEQPTHVTALPWLRSLVPFQPRSVTNVTTGTHLDAWIARGSPPVTLASATRSGALPIESATVRTRRTLPGPLPAGPDPYTTLQPENAFNTAEIPVVTGDPADGQVLASLGDLPVVISANRGRGTITALTFSPEREPFRSWNLRSWFWARVVGVPGDALVQTGSQRWGGTSIDGILGAMLDSRQVRKLPVAALLLLLVVYLAVIGPVDQWVLKRLGKQMWTWVTFPTYVVLFSGLIYFIGYRLRAGDLELNEIQIVDQLPRNDGVILRGRTWLSIYSPENARYRFASDQPFATFRAESLQGAQAGGNSARMTVRQPGRGFQADAFVPVWVSQIYSSDWIEPGSPILAAQVTPEARTLRLENRSELRFSRVVAVFDGRIFDLGELAPGASIDRPLDPDQARDLDELVATLPSIHQTVQQRRFAFGGQRSGQLDRNLDTLVAASFVDRLYGRIHPGGETFATHATLGTQPQAARNEIIIFAWAPDQAVAAPVHRFTPKRTRRDTVVRSYLPTRDPA